MSGNPAKSYDLLEKIGEGSFGEVHLASEAGREGRIALKFLRLDASSSGSSEAVALFKREFELLRELQHPHLASVYDFGFDAGKGQYFFSQEYCPGTGLLEAFRGRPLEFLEDVLVQVLSALDFIHSQGVVHFDIKPDNILVQDREGAPFAKLLDFGVAGRLRSTLQGVGGSPAYMAPELLEPNPKADPRSDLYSLGMVALEALTGGLPFDRSDPEAARAWHRSGAIPEAAWQGREIPGYLRELTEKLVRKNPAERFSGAAVALNFLNLGAGGRYRSLEAGLRAEIPLEGPLIERKEEVLDGIQQRLREMFSEGAAPAAETVFLHGERGIGKTRLLEELRQFLAVREIRYHSLICDWEIPSWPRLAKILELPTLAKDDLNRDWQIRRRIDALCEAAAREPFCLMIDDLQKADRDFRETLDQFVTAVRQGSAKPGGALFLIGAGEEAIEGGIALQRLSPQGVLQYVQRLLGRGDRGQELADLLFRYSGGLPLLVAEGLRYLGPRFLRGEALEDLKPASNIVSLYHDKLAALAPREETLLYLVALVFRPVPEAELGAILEISGGELGPIAKNPQRLGLISSRFDLADEGEGATLYQVNSQALASALIEGLAPERRRELHRAVAEGLRRAGLAPLEEIAYHLGKAGLAEEAAEAYQSAAHALEAQGQIASAARCFAKATDLCPEGSPPWIRMVTEMARLSILSGSYPDAEAALAKVDPYPSWEVEDLKGRMAFKRRDFAAAREHYQKALASVPRENATQRILLENALGNVDLQDGRPAEAAERFQRSQEAERALPPEERDKIDNNQLGLALVLKGDEAGALAFYAERARRLEGRGRPEAELSLLNCRAYVCLRTGHYQEAISHLKRAMQLAERSGALHTLSTIMGNLITALIKESRYAESLPLLQKIVAFQTRLGNRRDVAYNLMRQGSVYLTLGMGEKAKACFRSGREFSQHLDLGVSLWFSLVEGYWEREHGDPQRGWEIFRELESSAEAAGLAEIRAWAAYARADLAYEQGKLAECRKILSSAAVATQDKEFLARLHLLEAKLSASERGQDPEKLFAEVADECKRGHYREILWEVYHDWALNRERRQGPKAAQPLYEQGVQIVEAIVGSLPEEYRDRYLNQRLRKKLYQDWKHSQEPPPSGMGSRIKGFLRMKLGRATTH